jgi:lysophospholipase L1-like esterase
LQYRRRLQRALNIVRGFDRIPVIATLVLPAGDRASLRPFVQSYSNIGRALATANGVALIDIERAWINGCGQGNDCDYLNLPEGLHPTPLGYSVIAQVAAAALLGIDIFAADGATQLSDATSTSIDDIVVVPDAS